MFRKFICIVSFVSFFGGVSFAQEATEKQQENMVSNLPDIKSGKAYKLIFREKGTGNFLRKTEVKIGEQILYSDNKGILETKLNTNAEITVSRVGYISQTLKASELGNQGEVQIFLFPDAPDDNEVIVRGKKRVEVSKKTVSVEESIKVAPGGDPVQVAKLLPGIQSQQGRGGSGLIIRGSGPDDSRFFIDDVELPRVFHPVGSLSVIPDQLLDELEFSTGGFGVQFGNATGGIINLKTKLEVPERSKFEAVVKFPIYAGIYYEDPIDEESVYSVSARRSFIQYLLPKILEQADEPLDINVVPYFGDFHGQYFKLLDDGHYKLNFFNIYDGISLIAPFDGAVDESGKANFEFYTGTTFLSVQRLKKLNADWNVRVTPSISHSVNKTDVLANKFNLVAVTLDVPFEFTRRLDRGEKLYLGGEVQAVRASLEIFSPRLVRDDPFYDFESAPSIAFDDTFTGYSYAGWTSVDKKFGDFTLSPGLRVSKFNNIDDIAIDPRFTGQYKISKEENIKFAYGQYSKGPEVDEANKEFGNTELSFERSIHHILGWEKNWTDKWSTEIQAFYKRNYDVIRSDPVTKLDNDGSGFNQGLEVFIRRNRTSQFFGWLSYTYSQSKERENDSVSYLNTQYDQTHLLTLVGSYKLSGQWEMGGRIGYETGKVYTPIKEALYNANIDKYQPIVSREDTNTARLPNVVKLSLYGSKDFLWDTSKIQMRFGVEDYYVGEDTQSISYNYDYSDTKTVKGIPFIPYLEIRATL